MKNLEKDLKTATDWATTFEVLLKQYNEASKPGMRFKGSDREFLEKLIKMYRDRALYRWEGNPYTDQMKRVAAHREEFGLQGSIDPRVTVKQ
jgi:hypothetical protein